MASVGLLPKCALLVAIAALALALAGLCSRGTLTTFTAQSQNTGNTFTTASCFPGDTGFLNPTAHATDSGGDGNGFELGPTNAFADGGGKVYWADQGTDKIQRANLDGSSVQDLVTTGLAAPHHIALDVNGGKIYWADNSTVKIQRANLDGSSVQDLVTTGLAAPSGIDVDVNGGKVYWMDQGTDKIQRANLDGTSVEDLVTTGLIVSADIALDVAGGKMYWADAFAHKVQRANLDGSSVEDLITELPFPDGIALDVAAGKMYWTDPGSQEIQRANLDGSGVEALITTGLAAPIGIALDVAAGKMYWADGGAAKIQRANLDGSGVQDLVTTGLSYPTGIAVDGGYAINNDGAGDRHGYYDYGISVLSNCSVTGIEVRVDWWLDNTTGANSLGVELSWGGGTSWTAAKTDTTETTSEHTATFGGSTDTWGRAWTAAELSDANFRMRVTSNSDSSLRDFFLDWAPVKVYYGP